MTTDQEEMLKDVHDAIVGNIRLGNKGLVVRIQELEDYRDKDVKFKQKVAGGIAVGTPLLIGFWHKILQVLGL